MSITLGELADELVREYGGDRERVLRLVNVYAKQLGVEGAGEQFAAEDVEVSWGESDMIRQAFASAATLDMLDSIL